MLVSGVPFASFGCQMGGFKEGEGGDQKIVTCLGDFRSLLGLSPPVLMFYGFFCIIIKVLGRSMGAILFASVTLFSLTTIFFF